MKEPPDKRPSHKTVKTSLKAIAKNDVIIEKLGKTAIMASKIMRNTLQLLKLYYIYQYDHGLEFPKLTRAGIKPFLKIVCQPPKQGKKPSKETKDATDQLSEFYNRYYRPLQKDELSYLHMNTCLDYLSDNIVTMYQNNISQRWVSYVERTVNVRWKKRETIELISKMSLSTDKKKHLVSKLTSNLRRVKNDVLHLNLIKTSAECYHTWIDEVQNAILPTRPLRKDSVFYDVVCQPEDYLRGMIYMMKFVESEGHTISNCFPLRREVMPKYVPIDTTTLVHVLFTKESGKKGETLKRGNLVAKQDELWELFFKTNKQFFHSEDRHDYQFAHMIETDGVGCSILLVRKDLKGKFNKTVPRTENKERYIDQLDSYDDLRQKNIVAIDPNKSDLVYCIDSESEKFRYTQNQRRKETKVKKYRDIQSEKKTQRISGKSVIQWETELSFHNSRTLDFASFRAYIKKKNEVNSIIGPFYEDRIFRKLKLGSVFMRQQTEDNMLNRFEKRFGSPEQTLIGMGDFEQKTHMKFREPVKGKGFRNLLRKRGYEVYLVYEFKTSCRCSSCGGETKTFRKCRNPRPWKRDEIITRWGLVICQDCSKCWNRDYNASRNIHKICQSAICGSDRPDYLKRSRRPISDATSALPEEGGELS